MPIPKHVLLVVNPISGGTDKSELIELVQKASQKKSFTCDVYETTGQNDPENIREFLQNQPPARVLIAGGDGTITLVANLLRDYPEIIMGLLPVGSANGLATDFGLPVNLSEALEVALGPVHRCMDGMLLNGKLGLHLSDLGLNAHLVKNYESGEARGKWGYAKEVIRTLTEHDIFRVRIQTDTELFVTDATIVILANARMYGTGVIVNPKGDICDGVFEVIVATRFDVIELAKVIAGSTEFDPDVVRIIPTTQAVVECLSGQALFQIDGEYMGKVARVEATILPHMLSIAVPGALEENKNTIAEM
ncbi:diacylglycerol/lipid kinase family protein [Arundinibacter roseus]|uniref:Diacylglycerol kinase n=1 Tax=Arundinibacter roseus TaxID=2070510 RepID=A0A4R4KFZ6_9BACT|nr:diacylglycerol kinase family protein [Arundinibacter roseus]TDB66878.1 diacylglycerol kinase [Arundinibacter roseus]